MKLHQIDLASFPFQVGMREDEDGNIHMQNLQVMNAGTEEEALNLLFLGDTNRVSSRF